jgi:four helix bundle protein
MQDPRKLVVYGEAGQLAVAVYRLTLPFPFEERFGLTQQLRRAAVSVGSNVAEGCGRKGSRALIPFLHNSIGSANEVEFQAELAVKLGYCSAAEVEIVLERVLRTRRMLIRLEAAIRKRLHKGPPDNSPPPTPHPISRDSSPMPVRG